MSKGRFKFKIQYMIPMRCLIFLFCGAGLLSSCSHKISPQKPIVSVVGSIADSLPESEINIPIQINLKPVYAMAEKSVDTLFTSPHYPDDWVQDGCDTRYKYTFRRGPLVMTASGNSMNLGFTGYYRIIGSTRVCVSGTVISPWTPGCKCGFNEPERRVNVSFTNSLSIMNDYKVHLNFKRNEPQALDKCEVCFWGQDITKQVIKGLSQELDDAKKDLDKQYETVDLKSRFQQVWDQLNKVYDLYGLGWLQINPQKIRINSFYAKNDSLNVVLGLSARPAITFEKPAEQNSWVPNIGDASRRSGFNIFLDAVLNYDSLSRLLNLQVAGKKFDLDKGPVKKTFIIKSCALSGSSKDKVSIKVNFTGSNDGTMYLIGRPAYDAETRILELKDIDFDLRSKDALLKAADWLFSKKITTEIAKYSRFDLKAYTDTAKATINKQLNKEWIKGIRSYGNISDIRLIGVYPLDNKMVIRSNCTGELSVKVDSIDFTL